MLDDEREAQAAVCGVGRDAGQAFVASLRRRTRHRGPPLASPLSSYYRYWASRLPRHARRGKRAVTAVQGRRTGDRRGHAGGLQRVRAEHPQSPVTHSPLGTPGQGGERLTTPHTPRPPSQMCTQPGTCGHGRAGARIRGRGAVRRVWTRSACGCRSAASSDRKKHTAERGGCRCCAPP